MESVECAIVESEPATIGRPMRLPIVEGTLATLRKAEKDGFFSEEAGRKVLRDLESEARLQDNRQFREWLISIQKKP